GYDSYALHEIAAELLQRKHNDFDAWREYLAYADALATGVNRMLDRQNVQQYLPAVSDAFVRFVADKNKTGELGRHFAAQLDKSSGNLRTAYADVLLAFVRTANKPED